MGVTASTADATSINQLLQQQANVCTNQVYAPQVNNCPPITLDHCSDFTALCENLSVNRQSCTMAQTSSMVQQAMTHTGATAQGGVWGITIADSSAVSQNLVQNFMTQMCDNVIVAPQNITASSFSCKDSDRIYLTFINKFTSSTACAMTQYSKTSQSAAATSSAAAKGYDPFGDLAIIVVVLIIGIIGAVLVFTLPKKGGGAAGPTYTTTINKSVAPNK